MQVIDGNYSVEGKKATFSHSGIYDYSTALKVNKDRHITFIIPQVDDGVNFNISIFETEENGGYKYYKGYSLYQTDEVYYEKYFRVGQAISYREYEMSADGLLDRNYQNSNSISVFSQFKPLDKVDIKILENGEAEYYINNEFLIKRPSFVGILFRNKRYLTVVNDFIIDDLIELNKYDCELLNNQINVDFNYKSYAVGTSFKYYLSINNNEYFEINPIYLEFYRHIIENVYWGIYSIRLKIENEYKTFITDIKNIYVINSIQLKEEDKTNLIYLYSLTETDFRHNGIGKIKPIQAKITEASGILNAEFTLLNNDRNNLIEIGSIIKCRVGDNRNNQLFRVRSITKDGDYINVYCYCYLINDLGDNYVKDININNKNIIESIQYLLDNTIIKNDFKVIGSDTNILTPALARKNFKNLIFDTENSIISNYDCMVTIDNDKLIVNKNNKEIVARDRKNIIEIETDIDNFDICTCVVPYSNDGYGLDEVYVLSPLVNNYPSIHSQEVIFQDINISDTYPTVEAVKEALREKTKELFSVNMIDIPYQNFTLKIFETEKYGNLTVNDTVLCRHKKLNITFEATVIQREYNPLSNRNTSITLGVNRKTLSEVFRTNQIKKIEKGITAFATKKYVELQSQSLAETMKSEMLDLTVNNVEMDYILCQLQLGI